MQEEGPKGLRVMSGHEAAKREEDGDKSVEQEDAVGETFAGIKCYPNIAKLRQELLM